jgi:predicted ferric reductase
MRRWYFSLVALNVTIVTSFWWRTLTEFWPASGGEWLVAVGRWSGLAAVLFILNQVFLMSRISWLEQAFGQDGLARIHKQTGKLAYTLLLVHPFLIITGYSMLGRISFLEQFTMLLASPALLQAAIAVILFTIVVGTSLYLVRSRIKYEWWYAVHLLTYLAILLAWAHQLQGGTDFITQPWLVGYWYGLYGLVLAQWLGFRVLTPAWRFHRHQLQVEKVVDELPGVTSVYLQGRNLDQLHVQPGQFGFFRFLQWPFGWEIHPFSFSAVATTNQLRITAKQVGDFTTQLSSLKPGTKVWLEGPYGIFTARAARPDAPIVLIAGGIGVTPLRSMAEQFAQAGRDLIFIYSNRTLAEAALTNELTTLSQKYDFPLFHCLSQETGKMPNKNCFPGRLDADRLRQLIPDASKRDIYVCGSPPFMQATLDHLKNLGVPAQQLHSERFEL